MLLGTQRLPVSRPCASGSLEAVQRRAVKSCPSAPASALICRQPVRHIFFQLRAIPSAPDRLSGHILLRPRCFSSNLAIRLASTPPSVKKQRRFPPEPTGFRPCLCPHRTLFLCCRCAECKLVGASKARCSGRCPLPHRCREPGRRFPGRVLEEA